MEESRTIPFQTETVALLNMMIHSVYADQEVFLRELISNASDAIDKRFRLALDHPEDGIGPLSRKSYMIRITPNKEKRLLTISDNGIGMDEADLRQNLGTVAFSGTGLFSETEQPDEELIGRFGIGFYSLFMAADHVKVVSRKAGTAEAFVFESDGIDSYSIAEGKRSEPGTDVILHIRSEKTEGEDIYSRYLREYTIYKLVRKYSDCIRWPIRLLMPVVVPDEKGEPSEKWSYELLNSMTPLWKKAKHEVTEEDCIAFYREHFLRPDDFNDRNKEILPDPLSVVQLRIEGTTEFSALLFLPSTAWNSYDTKEDQKGIELYSAGVRIKEHCTEVLPEAFPFVRGAIDCASLPLTISRESIQSSADLSRIRDIVEKKLLRELEEKLRGERKRYEVFFDSFGKSLKLSAMEAEGRKRSTLSELLLFDTSQFEEKTTLKEYVSRLTDQQKAIYYIKGKSRTEILSLPEAELPKQRGIEFLVLTDTVDELFTQVLGSYDGHPFVSLSDGQIEPFLRQTSAFSKAETEALLKFLKETLKEDVADVIASSRLGSHPVLLTSRNGISFEMEQEYRKHNPDSKVKAEQMLEVNCVHPALNALNKARKTDPKRAETYAVILYQQARLIAGLEVKDAAAYTDRIVTLFTA